MLTIRTEAASLTVKSKSIRHLLGLGAAATLLLVISGPLSNRLASTTAAAGQIASASNTEGKSSGAEREAALHTIDRLKAGPHIDGGFVQITPSDLKQLRNALQ
ncbi:MAG: hypothetical protein V4671_05465 [Armatimonadota bacterium]